MKNNLDTKVEHGTENMKSVPYLILSKDGVYYYRRRVPQNLEAYFTKKVIKESLETKDFRTARISRDERNLHYQKQFDEKERLVESRLHRGSSAPIPKTDLIDFVLDADSQTKLGKSFLRQSLLMDEDSRLIFGEDSDQINQYYLDTILKGDSFKIKSEAIRNYKNIELFFEFAHLVASSAGIDFDKLTDIEKKKLTREYLIQEQEAGKVITDREQGVWVTTDKVVSKDETFTPSKISWQKVYELWEQASLKRALTVTSYKNEFDLFKAFVKNKPIEQITFDEAIAYQNSLIQSEISRSTVGKRVGFLKTIFLKAYRNRLLKDNPFDIEIVKPQKGVKARLPFDTEDLTSIFASPIYTKGDRPSGGAGEASVWIPILAYTLGARLEEICQLRCANLKTQNDIDYLEITNLDEEGELVSELKNTSSIRNVPLPQDLIDAGFIVFVKAQKGQYIFADLALRKAASKRSINWGKWFMRYLRNEVGITNKRKVFHSFRHTFIDICRNCGVSTEIRKTITGHKEEGMSAVYGLGYNLEACHAEMQKIKLPVKIPKLN